MKPFTLQYDAYCPQCCIYICDQRITFEECCDDCGTPVTYHSDKQTFKKQQQ
jgi:hypothetical protein